MKVNKREKLLLILLAFVAVGVVYYQFIYVKQVAKLEDLKTQEMEVSNTYETMLTKVNGIEKNQTDIKIFRESIESKSMLLYPKLYQDKIILEVNKLLNDAGIKGSLSFSEVTVAPVEQYFSGETTEGIQETLQQPADEIKQLNGEEVENNGTSNSGTNGGTGSDANANNGADSNTGDVEANGSEGTGEGQATTEGTGATEGSLVEQMKVSVSFSGTYANTTKFIKLVSDYARLVAMPTISLSASGEDAVSGSLDLEFYSIPKISEEDSEYLKWNLENGYGKENPFLEGSTGIKASENKEDDGYDVIMSVKGANSDLPSVILGKANDSTRDTYVYFDKNEKANIDIEISEENGKYYVKYKTPDSSYPSNYDSKGIEVDPGEGKIQIAVYSSTRLNVEDKVTVNVNVTSTTAEKMTVMTVMDDDKTNPRINVEAKGKVEYVIK